MAPLILHNVPDDELYVGDDGIQRPYAMVFPQDSLPSGVRARRSVAETGSFGKSTRRSRSRTGTPAKRENPTLAAADKIFGDWISNQSAPTTSNSSSATQNTARKSGGIAAGGEESAPSQKQVVKSQPTEVILRGYRNADQQYAAVNHYEEVAGRICEDYPRQPPISQRRFKSELRDPAFTRRKPLSPEERAKVNQVAGGEHWVKVTFESADAADHAIFASPQHILGCLVYAELYTGRPPARDEPCLDGEMEDANIRDRQSRKSFGTPKQEPFGRRHRSGLSQSHIPTSDFSPTTSLTSSNTVDTNTLSTTLSSDTMTETEVPFSDRSGTASSTGFGAPRSESTTSTQEDQTHCRRIPTARRATVYPAEQALLPQQSWTQRAVNAIPFLKWFSGSMIGNEVPRTDAGEFDWVRASLYWKLIWWLDWMLKLFGGEIVAPADRDD